MKIFFWNFFFREATELPSYRATELLAWKKFWNFFLEEKIKLPSYRATKLPSYWATGMKKISSGKKATKLLSYRATELLAWKKNSRNFFRGENKATKLPSYRTKNLRFHPHYLPLLSPTQRPKGAQTTSSWYFNCNVGSPYQTRLKIVDIMHPI